ncbi:hypothetical protein OEZ86_011388 [Tetradesmus obliquus]|nr:hypothetical protein OEZ86_011388 [Tetradesmus obliquus]
MACHVPLFVLLSVLLCCSAAAKPIPEDCKEHWYTQRLDHFHWKRTDDGQQPIFQQRYFVCDAHWQRTDPKGPIFFYAGNEGALEGYMNNTGLMFENAGAFNALILFAEHRYYGQTQPFGEDSWRTDPSFLTAEQAMADYATLLYNLTQDWGAADSAVVAFGGSYGGMLAAWMRRAYPHIIAGAVAASAPVGQFPGVQGFDPSAFWQIVTRDATAEAGAAPDCADNVRQAFQLLFDLGGSEAGRQQLQQAFLLCDPLTGQQQVTDLAYWVQSAFDAYAMGNYHFASDYMTGHDGCTLPAWPMRAACQHMTNRPAPSAAAAAAAPAAAGSLATSRRLLLQRGLQQQAEGAAAPFKAAPASEHAAASIKPNQEQDLQLLVKLRKAAGLMYNVTGDATCFTLDMSGPGAASVGPWDYQVCTEFLGQELPYFPAGPASMFWDQGPFDWQGVEEHCRQAWGVVPTKFHSLVQHGGTDWRGTSNIVFSNGLYDPWSAFGVMANVSDSVVAVLIADGAHHSDLMYARPDDSAALTEARATIMQHVRRWVEEHSLRARA